MKLNSLSKRNDIVSLAKLEQILIAQKDDLYIALSGGIDSITLMTVADAVRTAPTIAVHAVSAAVPPDATQRCRELALQHSWQLLELDAGELNNKQYVANPVNRCYYCKSSLFDSILFKLGSDSCIATGTNADDPGDYRPGLEAAGERGVWQPYVEAAIDKAGIREIAVQYGLGELSQLPAQPCLSSRIETGISINTDDLGFVYKMEKALKARCGAGDIRCRVVAGGIVVQLPASHLVFSSDSEHRSTEELIKKICAAERRTFLKIEPYKMGSAFVHNEKDRVADSGV